MNREGLRLFFRMGMIVAVGGVFLLFLQQPGTAEHVVTVLTIAIGALLMALAAWLARRQ